MPYPGCYALSKVLEEVMLEQYYIQYDLNGCCLRAPWIMEKDDFKFQLSFGEDVFGGPRWRDLVGSELADEYDKTGAVPVMLDPDGEPVGPDPMVTGFDTNGLCRQVAAHPWTWQVLNRKILEKELAISGSEHNPNIVDHRVLPDALSDHRAVVADIRVRGAGHGPP